MKQLTCVLIICLTLNIIYCDKVKLHVNKYSKELNDHQEGKNQLKLLNNNSNHIENSNYEKYELDFRNIQYPFRMAKLNLVWTKAQQRLTDPKLKSLFFELKIHDKEELNWKQLNSQHKDKDGLKEAELRLKLTGIMSTYDLLEHFEEAQDPNKTKLYKGRDASAKIGYKNKSLFKDKKLNHLWETAESAGFTPEELKTLKEEFEHHQDKINLYYKTLDNIVENNEIEPSHENAINEEEQDRYNEIIATDETYSDSKNSKHDKYTHKSNHLREKHREIRDSIDRLERLTAKGPNHQDFIESKVQGLWRAAMNSDFTPDELSSLKTELLHYESRLLKLRQMQVDHALATEKYKSAKHGDKKHDKATFLEENIRKQQRKVEKYHVDLEKRIFKHTEL